MGIWDLLCVFYALPLWFINFLTLSSFSQNGLLYYPALYLLPPSAVLKQKLSITFLYNKLYYTFHDYPFKLFDLIKSFWTLINKYVEDIQTSLIAYGNTFQRSMIFVPVQRFVPFLCLIIKLYMYVNSFHMIFTRGFWPGKRHYPGSWLGPGCLKQRNTYQEVEELK